MRFARHRDRLHLSVGNEGVAHVSVNGVVESFRGVLVAVYRDVFVLAHAELLGEGGHQLVGRQVFPKKNLVWWQEGDE